MLLCAVDYDHGMGLLVVVVVGCWLLVVVVFSRILDDRRIGEDCKVVRINVRANVPAMYRLDQTIGLE